MSESRSTELWDQVNRIEQNLSWLLKKGHKYDKIRDWGECLEELINLGEMEIPVYEISSYMRNVAKKAGLDYSMNYITDNCKWSWKITSQMLDDEDQYDTEISVTDSSRNELPEIDYAKKNAKYIDYLSRTIKVLKETKKALEKKTLIEPHLDKNEWKEYRVRWKYGINRLAEILDGREKVPPTTMHILIYCLANATMSHAYSQYVQFRKEEAELTPKQTGKIVKGHVSKMTLLYEPKNQMEALSSGFYGQSCEECGSFRTSRKYNPDKDKHLLYCFKCGNWMQFKTLPINVKGE